MKKIIAVVLMSVMLFSLGACGGAKESDYKLGMGVSLNFDQMNEKAQPGKAQVDATFAAVVLDGAGKIVQCRLDSVQNKMDVVGGAVDTAASYKTKMELGSDYGMVAYGGAVAEWDAQAKAFESFVVGKTADEVKNIETKVNDHGYSVPVDETLSATCTINVTEFQDAIVKACNDAKGKAFKAAEGFKLGAAAVSTAAESTPAQDADPAVVKMYSDYAAVVVSADGKVLAALTDATQPNIRMDAEGVVAGTEYKGTKRELGSDYGMVAYGAAIAEWDAQAQAFADFTVGKTASEIRGIETKTNDHGYSIPADETLLASCTMQVTGMMEVIARAAEYAR